MMQNKWLFMIAPLFFLLSVQTTVSLAADCKRNLWDPLAYQHRGDRCEGVKPRLLGDNDKIELVSATIEDDTINDNLSQQLQIKFYLPKSNNQVDLTVKNLDEKPNYRMDKLEVPWTKGATNQFEWPSNIVSTLKLDISNLGVLARLKSSPFDSEIEVAPVLLYSVEPLNFSKVTVKNYSFLFKLGSSAKLSYAIYPAKSEAPIQKKYFRYRTTGKRIFRIRWNGSDKKGSPVEKGFYWLVISSQDKDIFQSVKFYHKPNFSVSN